MIFQTKCRFLICVRVQYVEKLGFGREKGDGCCLTGKGKNGNILPMPEWWNGRHRGLKIPWRQLRDGSSPFSGTNTKGTLWGAFCIDMKERARTAVRSATPQESEPLAKLDWFGGVDAKHRSPAPINGREARFDQRRRRSLLYIAFCSLANRERSCRSFSSSNGIHFVGIPFDKCCSASFLHIHAKIFHFTGENGREARFDQRCCRGLFRLFLQKFPKTVEKGKFVW